MDPELQKALTERFDTLPEVVKTAITSANTQNRLRGLAKKHNLHIDQWGLLENEVTLTLLGFQEAGELVQNIESTLGVHHEIAIALAEDVSATVFEPIREELERQLQNPEAKEKVVTPEDAARKAILAAAGEESGSTPTPAAAAATPAPTSTPTVAEPALASMPKPATPPPPPPTEKAVRAPISSSYSAAQPSSDRKSVEGDPYREAPL